ncbi:MAG: peptidoglycan-associated lipoprotein Pal [Burkholderiales bacterium]|mgnify:FL=1|uniref:Peptidoglycan-associated lipoprotein n=1 Tax=Ottowia pentelensis TaxID=511108 RepID=A0ABV6PYJ6_9BURK|nr:peptidoglycan-associated lipoprotein Pal [Ottowia sp.]MBN9404528.1 peptidoglycan-associated lipoprotein Pal [Burkholderiales bacterium]MBS0404201.1 peptidoglycan-associated lipoprotein Pal [Pseudomonadota bacterium]MBS0414621.1 peptidoglycan-associated lipoprotein Pal [Pseudomonadota bacterium]
MFKRMFMLIAMATALVLAGCGSDVKLDQPAEGSSTAAGAGAGGAAGQGTGQSSVTQVQAGASAADKAGPVGVAKVILFDYDSYVVKPEYQSVVDQHARFLQSHPNARLVLEGNTDQRGSREYNLALGQKRAEAVRRALTLVGASDSQIEAVSFGKEKPAVEGNSEEAYAQNRRVEFRYQ